MSRARLLLWLFVAGLLAAVRGQSAPPNDDFENRIPLTATNVITGGTNSDATKKSGEPDLEGNAGGRSVWWTWTAPQNGTVTVKTAGSDFDTLLGVFTGSSIGELSLVASSDDTLGPEPLTSLVNFHAPSGAVYQIVVDGYRGDFGDIATGRIVLTVNFVLDRYTVAVGVNDTNRGAVVVTPAPDADGKYLVATTVSLTAQPQPGWFFDHWSGDLTGTNNPASVSLNSNLNVTANFLPVPVRTLRRSPDSFTRFGALNLGNHHPMFKVWHSETGTLDYVITTDVPWLIVGPTNGTTRGETNLHVIVLDNTVSLRVGSYLGTILITPLADGGQPQSIAVSLRIDPDNLKPQWQTSVPGGEWKSLRQTSDGGFIAGGGDGTVARLDARGTNLWTHSFGGVGQYNLPIEETADGGFLIAGDTTNQVPDFRVERLGSNGNLLWARSFGGTNYEYLIALRPTSDGGFLLAGRSASEASGNKTSPNFGGYDFWVIRLDRNGKRLWDQSYGGTNIEYVQMCEILPSGEILVGGSSFSGASGNKTNQSGGFWLVRLDSSGNKLAEQILPINGAGHPIFRFMPDGGFAVANSYNGTLTIVRVDAEAKLIWSAGFSGPFFGGIAILGFESSTDGGFSAYSRLDYCCQGDSDYEEIHLSAAGEILWRRHLLHTRPSTFTTVLPMTDGSLLFGGSVFQFASVVPIAPRPTRPLYSPLGFRFFLSGESNRLHVTEYSTNLLDWSPLQTNLLREAETEIFDTQAANSPQRFYRWHSAP